MVCDSENEQHTVKENFGTCENTRLDTNENPRCKHIEASLMTSEEQIKPTPSCCENKVLLVKTILSGQVLSLLLCSTGTAATALHTAYNVQVPCFNAFTTYTLLAFTFGIYTIKSKHFIQLCKIHGWKYFLISLLDVEANFLLTKAYSYTTLTSVQLCDSFTIPTVMVISFIFLRIRYKVIHYVGVLLCISGSICLVFSDRDGSKAKDHNIIGDIMALSGATLYGASQVGQEYLVKKYSWKKYLGMIGLVGFFVSGIQTLIIEKNVISSIEWNWKLGLIFLSFAVCQYLYYSVMPLVMRLSSATVVNLSTLTSDLYTLIVGLFLFGYKFSYMYFIAFGGIIVGLITYNLRPTPHAPPRKTAKKKRGSQENDRVTLSEFKQKKWHLSFRKDEAKSALLNKNPRVNYTLL